MSGAPLLRVVRGAPSPEELAALVAVLTARASVTGPPPEPPRRSRWGHPATAVRTPLAPGPGGWRASALPR